jgi:hypothetical protein
MTGCEDTVRGEAGLVTADGPGLLTDNAPVPGLCRSAAVKFTVSTVVLTTVVGRGEPFHNATEFPSKPVPVIVIVAAAPGGTTCGEIEVITGVGLLTTKRRS